MWDLGEYRKCGIRASTGKVKSGLIPEKVESERVSEMGDPGKYWKCGIWASTGNVGSGRVPEGKIRVSTRKGRIRASIGNGGSGRLPEMWDLGEYLRR